MLVFQGTRSSSKQVTAGTMVAKSGDMGLLAFAAAKALADELVDLLGFGHVSVKE